MSHTDEQTRNLLDLRREVAEISLIEAQARLTCEAGGIFRAQNSILQSMVGADVEVLEALREPMLGTPPEAK